jgi:hypothetical protein
MLTMKKNKVFDFIEDFYISNGNLEHLISILQKKIELNKLTYETIVYEIQSYNSVTLYGERLETDEEYKARMDRIKQARSIRKNKRQEQIESARTFLETKGYVVTKKA